MKGEHAMRITICDDNEILTAQLESAILLFFTNYHIDLPEISIFHSGEELLADKRKQEIVFLDVQMGGLDGIYVGNELTKANRNVIIFIVTSYIEYLDDAMRFHVFRYLTKPIDTQRLHNNLKDALQTYKMNTAVTAVDTHDGTYCVATHEIIMVEALGKKVTIYTTDMCYESSRSINYWSETLTEACFFKPHRSFIINFEYVNKFDHTLIKLYNSKYTAYLSRRNYSLFRKSYLLYLEFKK